MTESSSSRPLVRPRVVSQTTGESLYLEDALEPVLASAEAGAICIFGGLGSGKSSSLRYLSGRLPKSPIVELLDEPDRARVLESADRMVVIYTAMEPLDVPHLATLWLGPWGEDEALEYLLAAHKDRCASVLQRLRRAAGRALAETPELSAIVLDEMASDESLVDQDAALQKYLHRRIPARFLRQARAIAFRNTAKPDAKDADYVSLWGHPGLLGVLMGHGIPAEDIRLLRHPRVRIILAAERIVDHGKWGVFIAGLESPLPRELIARAGALLRDKPDALAVLERELPGRTAAQPMGASLLHAAGKGWKPPEKSSFCWFSKAYFGQADWPALRLPCAQLNGADLSGARLSRSKLDHATLTDATLRGATLWGASLMAVKATRADLSNANLGHVSAEKGVFIDATLEGADFEAAHLPGARFDGANLRRARFRRANLTGSVIQIRRHPMLPEDTSTHESYKVDLTEVDFTGAELQGAWLPGADLRTAILSGARFGRAHLEEAILEGVEAPGAFFEWAFLKNALLTGSKMPGASFRKADLSGARLGEIDWEKADLREANLQKVNFHMGSSRSGLVFCEPSAGTRTGFYTDEFYDQIYRAPEEFRTANLRGADLRGALLMQTDFYLVDLREARTTSEQAEYLRRCGAILETRV